MNVQLKAGKRWHDEEVAVVVCHRLFEDCNLHVTVIREALQQVCADKGLIQIRCHFSHKQPVPRAMAWLVLAAEVRVHRVPKLMCKRRQAEDVIVVGHHDERVCPVRAA